MCIPKDCVILRMVYFLGRYISKGGVCRRVIIVREMYFKGRWVSKGGVF